MGYNELRGINHGRTGGWAGWGKHPREGLSYMGPRKRIGKNLRDSVPWDTSELLNRAPCLLETALYGEQAEHRPAGPDCSQGKAAETLEDRAGRSVLAGKGAFWKPRRRKNGLLLT